MHNNQELTDMINVIVYSLGTHDWENMWLKPISTNDEGKQ